MARTPKLLTLSEASAQSGLHIDTLRWQIHNGVLEASKVGHFWVVTPAALAYYLKNHSQKYRNSEPEK